jgi:opacity protein-like surface antigen
MSADMPAYRQALRTIVAAAVVLESAPVAAQSPQVDSPQFEIAPFAGYRVGGGFELVDTGQPLSLDGHPSFALALDLRTDPYTQYELFYSRQSTTLRGDGVASIGTVIEYLQFGGTVALDDLGWVKPYFGGGLGLARLSPDLAGGPQDTRFALSFSLGLRAPLNPHLALRLEARGYWTAVNSDTAVFCRSDQGGALCRVRVQGSSFLQGDFLAGLAFTF